jgi:hypothetical protein
MTSPVSCHRACHPFPAAVRLAALRSRTAGSHPHRARARCAAFEPARPVPEAARPRLGRSGQGCQRSCGRRRLTGRCCRMPPSRPGKPGARLHQIDQAAEISRAPGQEAGVDRQEKDCRKLAKARGWDVTGIFPDNDRSATSRRDRVRCERRWRRASWCHSRIKRVEMHCANGPANRPGVEHPPMAMIRRPGGPRSHDASDQMQDGLLPLE